MELLQLIAKILLGCLLIILGCSFAYKCYRASVRGKMTYWTGFLPLSVISPFFVHIPARNNTLIKETTGLWVHILVGPVFLICSVLLIALGSDLAGLPGTQTLNFIINAGNKTAPPAIVHNRNFGFSFPIFARTASKFSKSMTSVIIPLPEDKKLFNEQEANPKSTRSSVTVGK